MYATPPRVYFLPALPFSAFCLIKQIQTPEKPNITLQNKREIIHTILFFNLNGLKQNCSSIGTNIRSFYDQNFKYLAFETIDLDNTGNLTQMDYLRVQKQEVNLNAYGTSYVSFCFFEVLTARHSHLISINHLGEANFHSEIFTYELCQTKRRYFCHSL